MYNGFFVNVAELCHFSSEVGIQFVFGTQHEDVGLDTNALKFFYRVLGRLGLQFAGSSQVGNISKVYAQGVFT